MTDVPASPVGILPAEAEQLYLDMRTRGSEVTRAIEVLGKTSGVFEGTGEYSSLKARARAWDCAWLAAANTFAHVYGLNTAEILMRPEVES